MIAVVDNGATKSEWFVEDEKGGLAHFLLPGFNPLNGSEAAKIKFIKAIRESVPYFSGSLWFYSAGTANASKKAFMHKFLQDFFPDAAICVDTDLTGTARAVFGNKAGLAAILGTGANAGLYDGSKIVHQPLSLGYLLGDEGSGAHIGKQLFKAYLGETLPEELAITLEQSLAVSKKKSLADFYSNPSANFLGNILKSLKGHKGNPYIEELVLSSFDDFFENIIEKVEKNGIRKIGFSGGVACELEHLLKKTAAKHHYSIDKVLKNPARSLFEYHLST